MPRLYDLTWEKPPALVERRLRLEVDERIDAHGAVHAAARRRRASRARSTRCSGEGDRGAGGLLAQLAAPTPRTRSGSRRSARAARARPAALAISSEVLPEIKEYERTCTTVINAYVLPIVRRYLASLARRPATGSGCAAPLLIMQSNGGLMTDAARPPGRCTSSSRARRPAWSARRRWPGASGIGKLITFDMGGTTAKAVAGRGRRGRRATEYQVGGGIMHGSRLLTGAGYLLRVPAIDLAEVGRRRRLASCWLDAGGALQVGPRSAGASPGTALLRPRRHRAHRHRCQPRPRLPQPGRAGRRRGEAERRRARTRS